LDVNVYRVVGGKKVILVILSYPGDLPSLSLLIVFSISFGVECLGGSATGKWPSRNVSMILVAEE